MCWTLLTVTLESLRDIVDSDGLRFSRRSLSVDQIQKGLTREAKGVERGHRKGSVRGSRRVPQPGGSAARDVLGVDADLPGDDGAALLQGADLVLDPALVGIEEP